jgi:hypothetical protein
MNRPGKVLGRRDVVFVHTWGLKDGFVKFDTSQITGEEVGTATFSIFPREVATCGNVAVHVVLADWNEKRTNWRNQPAAENAASALIPVCPETEGQVLEVDLSRIVRSWANGTKPNFGLLLRADTRIKARIDSKERAGGIPVALTVETGPQLPSDFVVLEDPTPGMFDQFGFGLAWIGDVNNDGAPDIAVGAPQSHIGGRSGQGQVSLFSGIDGVLLRVLDSPVIGTGIRFGNAVVGLGDVNGDGASDVAVAGPGASTGVHVFSGADGSVLFGIAGTRGTRGIAAIGDINGDSIAEILAGSPDAQGDSTNQPQGRARVFSGVDGSVIHSLENPDPDPDHAQFFGADIADVGDVDGDNISDFVIGAWQQQSGGSTQGRAFVYSGADADLLYVLDSPDPGTSPEFSRALAGGGDFNNDSVPDIIVGAEQLTIGTVERQGRAFVFSGVDGSLLYRLDDPDPARNAVFGRALATLNDIDGDSIPDIAVSAPGKQVFGNDSQGQVLIFSGIDGAFLQAINHPDPQITALFGRSLASLRDNMAVPGLVIGTPLQDIGGLRDQGTAYLFTTLPEQSVTTSVSTDSRLSRDQNNDDPGSNLQIQSSFQEQRTMFRRSRN